VQLLAAPAKLQSGEAKAQVLSVYTQTREIAKAKAAYAKAQVQNLQVAQYLEFAKAKAAYAKEQARNLQLTALVATYYTQTKVAAAPFVAKYAELAQGVLAQATQKATVVRAAVMKTQVATAVMAKATPYFEQAKQYFAQKAPAAKVEVNPAPASAPMTMPATSTGRKAPKPHFGKN